MLFNSLEFIIFFPIVTVLFFLFPYKFRWIHLLIASCVFYAAFIPSYLLILFLLIIIDYLAGLLIERKKNKKLWLVTSILANISLLAVFKYYNFFIDTTNDIFQTHFIFLNLALPIGLSFHTFQSMSYTIEVYKGRQKAITHPGYYALYVMFYPQLVAGPIERPQHMFPQFFSHQRFSSQHLYEGLRLMAWGFFKKTVIADRLGEYVDAVFNDPSTMNSPTIWLAVLFFSIQIYTDFSGYSDIAIGSARCMGFDLMTNFNRPYQASNIRDFWKRWHISLSSWFRDYVYIPLGGNRKGQIRTNINLLITFLLSGLWHGAGWTFVIWGGLHGFYVCLYKLTENVRRRISMPVIISWLLTGLAVGFAWIFFRANSLSNAINVITQSVSPDHFNFDVVSSIHTPSVQYGNFTLLFILASCLFMFFVEKYTKPKLFDLNTKHFPDIAIFVLSILGIIFYGVFHKTSFIYFQF